MTDYTFRIRFRIVDGTVLNEESTEREIALAHGEPYTLCAVPREQPINKSNWLVLKGPTFDEENQAWNAGRRAQDALRWCSARLKMGVDVGQDRPLGLVTEYGKSWLKSMFQVPPRAEVSNDVHGLLVYEDRPGTRFVSAGVKVQLGKNVAAFQDAFTEALCGGLRLPDKLSLAFDLYSASHFLSVPRAAHSAALNSARFLTLWTALESLTALTEEEDKRRSQEAIDHLEELIAQTKDSSLAPDIKDSLIGGLRHLYWKSTRQLCLELVEEYISDDRQYGEVDACSLVSESYKRRSSLTHGGSPAAEDLSTLCTQLDKLVADLLIELGGRSSQT